MVGVPRSSGCKMCVQKRIKCDETRPDCKECRRRNLICPGYPEKFPFCNRHMGNSQEPQQKHKYEVSYRPGRLENVQESAAVPVSNHQATATSMDNRVVPNLLSESLHVRQGDVFSWFVVENFSSFQAYYGSRVDRTWRDFTRSPTHRPPEFLQLAIHCISTFHLGQTRSQASGIPDSQYLYQYALSSVRTALSRLRVSPCALAAVFILVAYEIKNGLSQQSWLTHADAIAGMMQSCPAAWFSSGYGRTLFLTFRPFLIRAALAQNQPCFLERDEWVAMVDSTVRSEYEQGNGSLLGELYERAINEVVKVPGLVARTSSLLRAEPHMLHGPGSAALIDAITQCKNRLRDLQERILRVLDDLRGPTVDSATERRYLGPIPIGAAKKASQGCLEGIEWALTLLNSLEHHVAHSPGPWQPIDFSLANGGGIHDVDTFDQVSVVSYGVYPDVGWLDRCALSLGVIPSR